MTHPSSQEGYWSRLCAALLGRAAPPQPVGDAEFRARIATLELDLRERDERITRMQAEYTQLEADRKRAADGAGQEQVERLFKRLAGPLSNLAALVDLGRSSRDVPVDDLIELIAGLEKEFTRAGLERIGTAAEETTFDPALHQRMSGGTVHAGTPVRISIPGYRWGEKILLKAMVSAGEN